MGLDQPAPRLAVAALVLEPHLLAVAAGLGQHGQRRRVDQGARADRQSQRARRWRGPRPPGAGAGRAAPGRAWPAPAPRSPRCRRPRRRQRPAGRRRWRPPRRRRAAAGACARRRPGGSRRPRRWWRRPGSRAPRSRSMSRRRVRSLTSSRPASSGPGQNRWVCSRESSSRTRDGGIGHAPNLLADCGQDVTGTKRIVVLVNRGEESAMMIQARGLTRTFRVGRRDRRGRAGPRPRRGEGRDGRLPRPERGRQVDHAAHAHDAAATDVGHRPGGGSRRRRGPRGRPAAASASSARATAPATTSG